MPVVENLINKGYTIFYDGAKGEFDKKCANCVAELKQKYPNIKLIKILSNYQYNKENFYLSINYNDSIYPPIEEFYPKQRITKRNEWMVENSDILVCHIEETYKSGAYQMYKYAKKLKK